MGGFCRLHFPAGDSRQSAPRNLESHWSHLRQAPEGNSPIPPSCHAAATHHLDQHRSLFPLQGTTVCPGTPPQECPTPQSRAGQAQGAQPKAAGPFSRWGTRLRAAGSAATLPDTAQLTASPKHPSQTPWLEAEPASPGWSIRSP